MIISETSGLNYKFVTDKMKIALAVPLFKADDKSLFTYYRPFFGIT